MKVLVTRANGLSGANLVRELVRSGLTQKHLSGPGQMVLEDVECGVHRGNILSFDVGRKGQRYLLGGENLTYREFFVISGRKRRLIRVA